MGIFYQEIWRCKCCGHEFYAADGLYEADPNDFGTTHMVSPYYCPTCGNLKNVAKCISLDKPKPGNENLCVWDDTKCENCNTEMKPLKKKHLFFFPAKYKCPNCGKKALAYTNESSECMT